MGIEVSVLEGSVHVNEIALERATEHVYVFQADLSEKRAEVSAYGGSADFLSVVLYPEKDTTGESPTEIKFKGDFSGNWQAFAEVVRYTLTVLLFRLNPEAEVVWRDAQGETNG